jgi:hypothetical protein
MLPRLARVMNPLMTKICRRTALRLALFSCATLLIGCGGGNESAADTSPPPAPTPAPGPGTAWNPSLPVFMVGSAQSFDLVPTLPTSVAKGGTFGVSPNGAPLPGGMTLSLAGIIAVGTATSGQTAGVAFTYTEPGA